MRIADLRRLRQCPPAHLNHSDTMPRLSRRSFIAGSAAILAAPAIGVSAEIADVPVAIIGAGAAGIAAARRLREAKIRFAMIEAADRIGGRCVTDTTTFATPFDRGAHWIHRLDDNPLVKAANGAGLDIYPAPRGQKLRVPPRRARAGETEQFLAALVRANRAIIDAGRGRSDVAAASALPGDLGEWRDTIEFVLGPYSVGKALSDVSAADFARAPERIADAFCREGYGTVLAKLASGLPVQLSTPARKFDWGGALLIDTPKGTIRARTAIVTVSTNVLARGDLGFTPDLPKSHTDAASRLSLGRQEQIAVEMDGNPLDLDADDLVFEKASGPRTAALLGNIGGSHLSMVSVGGNLARDLARSGDDALKDFAVEWLTATFGSNAKGLVKKSAATRWGENPLIGGAFSAAAPGHADARRALMTPLRDRVWFAGEACHEALWGTVNGAWESGTRAAEAALRVVGGLPAATKGKPEQEAKPVRKRRRKQ
jgi:monoamine oxidase